MRLLGGVEGQLNPTRMALVLIPICFGWLGYFFVGLTYYPSDFVDILA